MKSLAPIVFHDRVHPLNGAMSALVEVQVASPFASETSTFPAHCAPSVILILPFTSSFAVGTILSPIPKFPLERSTTLSMRDQLHRVEKVISVFPFAGA